MKKVILHIDMNAYFATVAQITNPELIGKPVAVGGKTSRSIITTASYEARKFGVKSAMPLYQAKKLCPDLIVVKPDFSLYEKYTYMFLDIIKKYASKIEVASIDECYVDISEELSNIQEKVTYIKQIQKDIYETLGLQCSIGVAPNKFLAKTASDIKKPMGVTILSKENFIELSKTKRVGTMYGVGVKTTEFLTSLGIETIYDFANYENKSLLNKKLGKNYLTLSKWAIGEDDSEVETDESELKSIGNSTTLLSNTNDYDEIKEVISDLSLRVSERAKERNLYGFRVSIIIRDNRFTTISRSLTLKKPINDFENLLIIALKLLDKHYNSNKMVRLLGVTLGDLIDKEDVYYNPSIFDIIK